MGSTHGDEGGTGALQAVGAEATGTAPASLADADLLFFDGTVFTDDEMAEAGVGTKTGRRMGHIPVSGEDGSMTRLASLQARKIYFHINNTNPILIDGSDERRIVEGAGFEVAHDGMRVSLAKRR